MRSYEIRVAHITSGNLSQCAAKHYEEWKKLMKSNRSSKYKILLVEQTGYESFDAVVQITAFERSSPLYLVHHYAVCSGDHSLGRLDMVEASAKSVVQKILKDGE